MRCTLRCDDYTISVCRYNLFMVWQKYKIKISTYPPEDLQLATQLVRPECGEMCVGDGGGKAKMIHRVSPANWMLSALESIYLPQQISVTLFFQHTSTTPSYFSTIHLYKNIHVRDHALVAW